MEKLIYLVECEPDAGPDALRERILSDIAPQLLERGAEKLTVYVEDSASQTPVPLTPPEGETRVRADISLWLDCHDRREPCEELLRDLGSALHGYLVTESLYTEYGGNPHAEPRHWPDGERSPGLTMLTLLAKPDRLTYEQWIEHWYGMQSPVSERLQPRIRYVRNAVARALTPNAKPWLGIVEECWAAPEDITDPHRFYLTGGSDEVLNRNLTEMLESVGGFLELEQIRSYMLSEYILRS
ncbi:MAG: hypothetical protein ACI8TX_001711 [Hyphomicrobiaceae bacterium]|jgi:hypothetical protein